jgi:penicillin amidase
MPVPGNGRYEWRGFVAPNDMPTDRNPSKGWVASCNQVQIPESYSYAERRIGFEYPEAVRYRRLSALIGSGGKISVAAACRFQNDQTLAEAGVLVHQLLECESGRGLPETLRRVLAEWDGCMATTSPAAAFYAVWTEAHLRPRLVRDQACSEAVRAIIGVGDWRGLRANGLSDTVLGETAVKAVADLERRLGTEIGKWRLGEVQCMSIAHPLSPDAVNTLGIGPLPLGGHANTINKAESFLADLQVRHGPSFRIVLDVGDWDQSVAVNMPGQSGDPRSDHYRDMVTPWHQGGYVPLLWSREKVEAQARTTLELLPLP